MLPIPDMKEEINMNEKEFNEYLSALHDRVLTKALSEDEENNYTESLFESIRHVNEYGQEFWYARELQIALEYTEWRNFSKVIDKAKDACKGSNNAVSDHFVDVNKIVSAGATSKDIGDIQLSRYACYLIVQNGDPRKKVIALGQTYFAVKTRQQELIENYENLSEDQKRLAIRKEMAEHNKMLVAAAKDAGVETSLEYAIFQNYGYMGLYGGLKAQDIKKLKGLKKSQNILDHMGYEELAANLFRATQTEAKLRRDHVQGKQEANQTHYEVGKKVRQTIKDLGGTMPEDLPTPEKSIQQIEREEKKKLH
jgi:DNA-damage-inducible protein D